MNRQEQLQVIAMEECNELSQRIAKASRFGMDQVQVDQPLTNAQRIVEEYNDLVAAMEMLGFPLKVIDGRKLDQKIAKVERYLDVSMKNGTLDSLDKEFAQTPVKLWNYDEFCQSMNGRMIREFTHDGGETITIGTLTWRIKGEDFERCVTFVREAWKSMKKNEESRRTVNGNAHL